MRSYPILAVAAVTVLLAGCSSGPQGSGSTSPPPPAAGTPTTTTSLQTHTAAPGATGVSPNGVTTAVGTPAESTETEYFQACHAAKAWMLAKGGDQKTQFEPYLADLQHSDAAGPGTFGQPWSKLSPARQSAVIVAAEAASDDQCG